MELISTALEETFQWFVNRVWDRYGVIAALLSVLAFFALLFGIFWAIFALW